MKALLVSIGLAAVTAQTQARVGDSVTQIEARYGKSQVVLSQHGSYRNVGYRWHDMMVGVEFLGGVSKREFFARPGDAKLSPRDVEKILAVGAGAGLTWKP